MADDSQESIEQELTAALDDDSLDQAQSPDSSQEPVDYDADRIAHILDMKVPVIVKVADRTLPVKSIMRLHLGSIIQFEKDAYEHIELMVNNRTVGLGQPVKVGENFGLRLIQVGDLNDMIRSLGAEE